MMYLNYEAFVCNVQEKLQEQMGKEVQVNVRQITKNNGKRIKGLSILEENQNISPMIYMEEYYQEYQQGNTIETIIQEIEELYVQSKISVPIDPDFYRDFEKVKDRILCKLINYEKNLELLGELPHIQCMDLAVVFYYKLEHEQIGNGTILIYNNHLQMWGISKEELYETARENTPKILPFQFQGMKELLEESVEELEDFPEEREELPMYVLTDRQRELGAIHILYDSTLAEIGEKLGKDFYILPSSIHECIIVPVDVYASRQELEEMVTEINHTHVLPEEVLSDHVYLYEREAHRLSM